MKVRGLLESGSLDECTALLAAAMGDYPHAPQPHNLMGVLLEKAGDPRAAMKHYRAASALDPAYLPARRNLERFGSFYSKGPPALDEGDCRPDDAAAPPRSDGGGQDLPVRTVRAAGGAAGRPDFLHGLSSLIPIGEGRVYIAEVPIPPAAPAGGQKIWEIDLPPEVIIGCILRGEQNIVPRGDTQILAGDVLILISADRQKTSAIQKLTGRPRKGEP